MSTWRINTSIPVGVDQQFDAPAVESSTPYWGPGVLAFMGGAAPAAVTGALVATEATDAANSTATLAFAGVLAGTEAADAATAQGLTVATGTLVGVDGSDAASGGATGAFSGPLAAIEGADAVTIAGTVTWPSVVAVWSATEPADVVVADATLRFAGAFAAIESMQDDVAAVGAGASGGALLLTEPADAASVFATAAVRGTADLQEASDGAEFFTGVAPIAGTLDATEAQDQAALTGMVGTVAPAPAAWGAVIYYPSPAKPQTTGDLAAKEPQDTTSLRGVVSIEGRLAAADHPDGMTASGSTAAVLHFGARETLDDATGAGRVTDWIAQDNDFLLMAA